MSNLKKLTQKRLFLPVFCMILVLCINMIYDLSIGHNFYNFFEITMTNGMLNGRIINILNRGSEVAILAIGMTLVVSASAGTDISVGSVMSLCASFCCMLVAGFGVSSVSSAEEFAMPLAVGLIGALLMGCLCGAFNGGLVTALSEGKNLLEASAFANVVSNLAVTRMGTAPSMPTRREIDAFLEAHPSAAD